MEGCHTDHRAEGVLASALKGTNSTEAEEGLNADDVLAIEVGEREGWKLRLVCRFLRSSGSRIGEIGKSSLRLFRRGCGRRRCCRGGNCGF